MSSLAPWYAVRRGITKHPIFYKKPERLAVWMWLLDNACWKDEQYDIKGKTITVQRGQVCASERYISDECGVGYQVVRTLFARLKSEHMINAEVTHGKNVITLCNYEKYQEPTKSNNAAPNATLTQEQRTKKQGNNSSSLRSEENRFSPLATQSVEAFNEMAKKVGWPLVLKMTDKRKSALLARLKDGGIDGWNELLERAAKSDFLCGRSDNSYPVKFDWIINPTNAAKVVEGNYDNRNGARSSKPAPEGYRWFNGELIKAQGPKPKGATHENRKPDTIRAACDAETGAVCGQSPDALPTVQPHEEEEERWVSFSDDRAGRTGSDALSPLSMGVH